MLPFLLMLAVLSSPTPSPTARPTCDRDVVVVNAVPPDYPDSAKALHLGPVKVIVHVTVAADGSVVDESVDPSGSSGNAALDVAAIRAGRLSTYAPKMIACKAVRGTYAFIAEFLYAR